MGNFLKRFGPVIVWMCLMYYFSSRAGLPINGTITEDFLSKKLAHVLEYALLMLLMYRAAGEKNLAKALLFSLAFAFSDEIHQLFTPTRSGRLRDVGIDSLGLLISCGLIVKFKLWNSSLLLLPSKKLKK